MSKYFYILTVLFCLSCKDKDTCYPEYKQSLSYLKEYIDSSDNKTRLTKEIAENIELLESQSGILNSDQGNFLGKYIVTQRDIDKWEKWLSEKCEREN